MPDIEYVQVVAGQRHFHCASLHALLDTGACADRWHHAMQPDAERLVLCRRCPIGRKHHAEHHPELQDAVRLPERAPVCIRCGRPATRMVGNAICPSCFNRFREFLKGRNGRGNAPVTYRPPVPRRVGIVGDDGAPAWVFFVGQHFPEAMARATRAGLRLSEAQPGRTHWNADRRAFEYRDEGGSVLLEMEVDGQIEYIAADRLHPGEQPALVTMPCMLMEPEFAALWLAVSGEGEALAGDWRQLEFGCAKCQHGMLNAHRAHGEIIVRCSTCC